MRPSRFCLNEDKLLIHSKNGICIINLLDRSFLAKKFVKHHIIKASFTKDGLSIIMLFENEKIEIRNAYTLDITDDFHILSGYNVLEVDFQKN